MQIEGLSEGRLSLLKCCWASFDDFLFIVVVGGVVIVNVQAQVDLHYKRVRAVRVCLRSSQLAATDKIALEFVVIVTIASKRKFACTPS